MIIVFETIMLSKLYDLCLNIFNNETVGTEKVRERGEEESCCL